jgi:LmbE family N-acetylglucosaminyl deacetylase
MLPLRLEPASGAEPLSVLCLGAHCDDIEIGCGGTILRLVGSGRQVRFHWVVFCSTPERQRAALASAKDFLGQAPATVDIKAFRDSFLPDQWRQVKEAFESLKAVVRPDLILTHNRKDLHQDHRTIAELTWNTFRNHSILEYEIFKYDGDLGVPNLFVPLDEEVVERKCRLILEHFQTETHRSWFSEETFRAILKLRGVESNAPGGYAEAFYGRKIVLDV